MTIFDYFNNAKVSMFRFEALQNYDVGVDDMSNEQMIPWWDFIKEKTDAGVKMQRVRLIKYPLTEYTKTELIIHKKSVMYGDDIRTIDDDDFQKLKSEMLHAANLDINLKDFWLIDDRVCLQMQYDENGKWLGFEVDNEVEKYIKIKEALLTNSKVI